MCVHLFRCRGMGMVIGIDIVTDQESRKASKEIAELIVYG